MIQTTKNYKLFLISAFILFLLSGCKEDEKQIAWNNIYSQQEVTITVEFDNIDIGSNKKTTLISDKTNKISLKGTNILSFVEHNAEFGVLISPKKITKETKIIEIAIFPVINCIEQKEFYEIPLVDNVIAYFLECYDFNTKSNYYIFSEDNKIDKNFVWEKNTALEDVLETISKRDVGFYTNNQQEIINPYCGYVIKSRIDDSYLLLSTLWGRYCL